MLDAPNLDPLSGSGPSPDSVVAARSLQDVVSEKKKFHGQVVHFSEPHTSARVFSAMIDWGDRSTVAPGQIQTQGKGRYAVIGSHRYVVPGVYLVTVTIRDASGREIAAVSFGPCDQVVGAGMPIMGLTC